MRSIVIRSQEVEATILPEKGGGISRFDFVGDGKSEPIFRPYAGQAVPTYDLLASMVLVPWSNRISNGGFSFRGNFYRLLRNLEHVDTPVHGNGFQLTWEVLGAAEDSVVLGLASDGPGPFRYTARLRYHVHEASLTMSLRVGNDAAVALPFGCGFHPGYRAAAQPC